MLNKELVKKEFIFVSKIASNTRPDRVYTLRAYQGVTTCECEAYEKGMLCWHVTKSNHDLVIVEKYLSKVLDLLDQMKVIITEEKILEYMKIVYILTDDNEKQLIQKHRKVVFSNLKKHVSVKIENIVV